MTIAIGIVAHIDRQHMAEQLAEQVNADFISIDGIHQRLGCNANHRRTWTEIAALNPTVGVVLEDDAVVCPDFRHQLEQAIKASPTHITSLYLGRQRPHSGNATSPKPPKPPTTPTPTTCCAPTCCTPSASPSPPNTSHPC